jgi:hypothetical protein
LIALFITISSLNKTFIHEPKVQQVVFDYSTPYAKIKVPLNPGSNKFIASAVKKLREQNSAQAFPIVDNESL